MCIDMVQAKTTLFELCKELEGLEINAYQGMMTDVDKNLLVRSASTRERLEKAASDQRAELAAHMLSNNSAQEGIITFFKANVSLDVRPEPINLKEALKYILEHEDYESTGFALYDFFAADVDVQYDKIMKILNRTDQAELIEPISR
jgi:hypothetical protein